MSNSPRPHPFANPPVEMKEFAFLKDPTLATFGTLDNIGTICSINLGDQMITLSDDNDPGLISKLRDAGHTSAVGKGKETVMDEEVRKSHEYTSDKIQLEPSFRQVIIDLVKRENLSLNHPVKLTPQLHKLVIYKKGDFFRSHMDAPHSPGMIATLSIDIYTGERKGGKLQFEIADQASASKGVLPWVLFYHDVKHSVSKVLKGWKVSLVFDVYESESKLEIPSQIEDKMKLMSTKLDALRSAGIKHVGLMLNHTYLEPDNIELEPLENRLGHALPKDLAALTGRFNNGIKLKGYDRVMYEFFKRQNLTPTLVQICINEAGFIFDQRLLSVFRLCDTFGELYVKTYRDKYLDSDEDEKDDNCRPIDSRNERNLTLNFDPWGKYEAVSEHCRLGHVLFIHSKNSCEADYIGNEEVHLGNNGFSGSILSNLAMIVDIG